MWQRKKLQHGEQSRAVATGNVSPDLRVRGVKIGVHNWSHGIKAESGKYLTPENACKAFIEKLIDNADLNRPKGEQDVVLIMVVGRDILHFQQEIEKVAVILPEPAFKQAFDYAKAEEQLAVSRMTKTPPIASPAFAQAGDITPQSARALQSIALQNQPTPASGDPFEVIARLKQQKAQREAESQQKIAKILNTSANVYAFVQRGELAQVATELLKQMPSAEHIFTACVCFIGSDLSLIKGMLHDEQ